jgi:hypothetical protein
MGRHPPYWPILGAAYSVIPPKKDDAVRGSPELGSDAPHVVAVGPLVGSLPLLPCPFRVSHKERLGGCEDLIECDAPSRQILGEGGPGQVAVDLVVLVDEPIPVGDRLFPLDAAGTRNAGS